MDSNPLCLGRGRVRHKIKNRRPIVIHTNNQYGLQPFVPRPGEGEAQNQESRIYRNAHQQPVWTPTLCASAGGGRSAKSEIESIVIHTNNQYGLQPLVPRPAEGEAQNQKSRIYRNAHQQPVWTPTLCASAGGGRSAKSEIEGLY